MCLGGSGTVSCPLVRPSAIRLLSTSVYTYCISFSLIAFALLVDLFERRPNPTWNIWVLKTSPSFSIPEPPYRIGRHTLETYTWLEKHIAIVKSTKRQSKYISDTGTSYLNIHKEIRTLTLLRTLGSIYFNTRSAPINPKAGCTEP